MRRFSIVFLVLVIMTVSAYSEEALIAGSDGLNGALSDKLSGSFNQEDDKLESMVNITDGNEFEIGNGFADETGFEDERGEKTEIDSIEEVRVGEIGPEVVGEETDFEDDENDISGELESDIEEELDPLGEAEPEEYTIEPETTEGARAETNEAELDQANGIELHDETEREEEFSETETEVIEEDMEEAIVENVENEFVKEEDFDADEKQISVEIEPEVVVETDERDEAEEPAEEPAENTTDLDESYFEEQVCNEELTAEELDQGITRESALEEMILPVEVDVFEESGRVYDFEKEKGIQDVLITFTRKSDGLVFNTSTDKYGEYIIELTSGVYTVSIKEEGFYDCIETIYVGEAVEPPIARR